MAEGINVLQEQKNLSDDQIEDIKDKLKEQEIETPSWGYADSGTRFNVFEQEGVPETVFDKIDDAQQVHKHTGITPSVALHIPWDMVDDWKELRAYAEDKNMRLGAINPNLFQDDDYKLGSLTHPDKKIRQKALNHMLECVDVMRDTNSKYLSLWLADGTNYPGQDDFRARKHRLEDTLGTVYSEMDEDMIFLIEYKFFEPGFYHTDLADWGMATNFARKLGDRAKTLVDLGHHPLGTNIEHIVSFLIDEDKLGGFHFNNKKYADDDLTSGSIKPYELFLIFNELITEDTGKALDVAYMIDQSHNIKPKIAAMIQSVVNIQIAYAKSLLVDREALTEARLNGDVIKAEEIMLDAFRTDVRPLLEEVRKEMDCPAAPLQAFNESGYIEKIKKQRG